MFINISNIDIIYKISQFFFKNTFNTKKIQMNINLFL